ncbi:hypothetical protein [Burkholderia cepacia]|uniref:hypothetical protein n=1 Tax=Burkholderia cepacia TaxID=292 RepID=UPI003D66A254
MKQIVVTRVAAYSDDSKCAEVTPCCGEHEITVFSFGGTARVNDIVRTPVSAVDCDVRAACLDDWRTMQGGRPAGNGSGKPQTRMVIADTGRSSTGSRG